jgi:hypothetical protein
MYQLSILSFRPRTTKKKNEPFINLFRRRVGQESGKCGWNHTQPAVAGTA